MRSLNIIDLGLIDYTEALKLQKQLVQDRIDKKMCDTLILCEHRPVITLGRKSGNNGFLVTKEFLKKKKIPVFEVERGGEATYHGPGQIVGYPIFGLNDLNMDVHEFLRAIEKFLVLSLNDAGVKPCLRKGLTGVWVREKKFFEKIAFIGISARKWVTYHGFSINIDCRLEPFSWIVPCGINEAKITSLKRSLKVNSAKDLKTEFKKILIKRIKEVFNYA